MQPLTLLEVQHALAVNIRDSEFDEESLREIDDIVSVCTGLVTLNEESAISRLVHYTMHEYFERIQQQWSPNTATDITRICITYLSFSVPIQCLCEWDLSNR